MKRLRMSLFCTYDIEQSMSHFKWVYLQTMKKLLGRLGKGQYPQVSDKTNIWGFCHSGQQNAESVVKEAALVSLYKIKL